MALAPDRAGTRNLGTWDRGGGAADDDDGDGDGMLRRAKLSFYRPQGG